LARKPSGWRINRPAGAETGGLAQKPAGWRRNRPAGAETVGIMRIFLRRHRGLFDLAAEIVRTPA
jgi:hypothetical protein